MSEHPLPPKPEILKQLRSEGYDPTIDYDTLCITEFEIGQFDSKIWPPDKESQKMGNVVIRVFIDYLKTILVIDDLSDDERDILYCKFIGNKGMTGSLPWFKEFENKIAFRLSKIAAVGHSIFNLSEYLVGECKYDYQVKIMRIISEEIPVKRFFRKLNRKEYGKLTHIQKIEVVRRIKAALVEILTILVEESKKEVVGYDRTDVYEGKILK